ncbi:neuroblastoma breakpoint family member 6-like protein [Cavia porcellus]|uniref:neuroblastoma breakpoint family member 6-like protein n=1 Tax=Cavia porcellus TaxID=10141 RepID=UPI002FE3884A
MGIRTGPSCHLKDKVSVSETEQKLRVQLEESKENFYKLKERFLLSEATVYAMANELQKHGCQKFKDIIESVLGEELNYLEGSLAEKGKLVPNLREYSFQIQDQDQKLSVFQQKLQQGIDASYLLCKHLTDHLPWDDLNNNQGHKFHELLAEGCRLAEDLVRILSPENQDNEDNEKEQESLALSDILYVTSLSTEGINEEKVAEILPDSLGEGPETSSHHYDLTDIHEPFCTATALSDAHEVRSSLDAAQNVQDCKDEAPLLNMSRKDFVIIQDHAKKLTQLREQLGKGRDASLSLEHHLEFLLTHDDPEDYQGQGYIQQLAQGCKMAANLVLMLSEGNNERGNNEKEETELLSKMDDQDE